MRLRIEYGDQNESFASCLPRDGTVMRQLAIADWGNDWHLVALDKPFVYGSVEHKEILVRSRWQGHTLGDAEPTAVFIFLIPNPVVLRKPLPRADEFEHVAWGMATTLVARGAA